MSEHGLHSPKATGIWQQPKRQVELQSKLRMQAAEAEHNKVEGQSNVRTLAPGFRFKPDDVSDAGNEFEEHAILTIVHTARAASNSAGVMGPT